MSELTDLLHNGLASYGPLVLGISLLFGALGTPVPTTLLVVAAGALSRYGTLDWRMAFVAGLTGAVLGDSISYGLGRFANGWVQRRFARSATWHTAHHQFERWGMLLIYLSRFLLIPLAIPANLIAGGSGYRFQRFLTYDVAGEVTWLVLFGGLGYAFGSQWPEVSEIISSSTSYLLVLLTAGVAGYVLVRYWRQKQFVTPKAYLVSQ